ncbi:titin homolog isoform X2 [Frankliniella occidentalis]|uniref:Titin homolog isoform X2 n=1 Tax=Frankliniella occidentalis TaxID=133901 RepID=A0A9C6WYL4_FRAOC|nr:titin homolog isoform X2 [Frankliniella occidentalis]
MHGFRLEGGPTVAGHAAPEGVPGGFPVLMSNRSLCPQWSRRRAPAYPAGPSMKNSAFAVDPCPRDLLGKQWLFMHMSSHYRRMCSAQSVVDSAPPASLRSRAPRSARQPARLSQKPSRADTDPGPGAAARVSARVSIGSKGLDGRASAASASSRRQFEYNASVLQKPPSLARHRRRDVEKQGTYYDKLNQLVPDHTPQRSGLRTSGQILSEVFTPRVPHKPQVLRTEVPSRLRFSNTYCPPRSKSHRVKTVAGQSISKDAEQSVWTPSQTSPPVSSRDSAYNGGISSGGESRGPTPDHKGTKKQAKKAERKGKRMVDHKPTHSIDSKPQRKFEKKLMNKLLEEERNEIQEQRLKIDPWHGISQDDHGDEILRNIQNLHIDSNEEYSSIEHGSPLNDGSASDQSIEEDMMGEVDEAVEVETNKDDVQDSLERDMVSESAGSEETFSHRRSFSTSDKQQAGTQTPDIVIVKNNNQDHFLKSTKKHSVSSSHSVTSSSATEKNLSSQHPSHDYSSRSQSVKTSTSEADIAFQVPAAEINELKTSEATQDNSEKNKKEQGNNKIPSKSRCSKVSLAKFLYDLAKAVAREKIVTDKGLKAVYDEHIAANCDKLDKEEMEEQVKKFHTQLEISMENYLGHEIHCPDASKMHTSLKTDAMRGPLDVENLSPLMSEPDEIWKNFVLQHKLSQANNAQPLHTPIKCNKLGLVFTKFEDRTSLSHEPVIAADDELTGQRNVHEKQFLYLPIEGPRIECKQKSLFELHDSKIGAALQIDSEDTEKPILEESNTEESNNCGEGAAIACNVGSSFLNSLRAEESIKFDTPSPLSSNNSIKSHLPHSLLTGEENLTKNNFSSTSPTIEIMPSSIQNLHGRTGDLEKFQFENPARIESFKESWLNGKSVVNIESVQQANFEDRKLVPQVSTIRLIQDSKVDSKFDKQIGKIKPDCKCKTGEKNTEARHNSTPESRDTPLVFLYSKKSPVIDGSQLKSKISINEHDTDEKEIDKSISNICKLDLENKCVDTITSHSIHSELPLGTGVNSDIMRHEISLKHPVKGPV